MTITFKKYLSEKLDLQEDEYEYLQPFIKNKKVSKNEFLLRQGEICKHSFFVEKGLLRLYNIGENGKEHIIQFAPEEWFITDRASTFFKEPTEFFMDALEDSDVVMLENGWMNTVSSLHKEYAEWNEILLQRHIHYMQKRINLLLSATAEERYLNFIELYPQLMLRVPQWMIASYLGITPESLSRVRKELANKNFKIINPKFTL